MGVDFNIDPFYPINEYNRQKERKQDRATNQANADRARADQMEFAKHGLQWKVADAKAAGLSPLAALGGSANFSPASFVGQSSRSPVPSGQNLSRAAKAGSNSVVQSELDALTLENARLQNKQLEGVIESQALRNIHTKSLPTVTNEMNTTKFTPLGQTDAKVIPTIPNNAIQFDVNEPSYGDWGSSILGLLNMAMSAVQGTGRLLDRGGHVRNPASKKSGWSLERK